MTPQSVTLLQQQEKRLEEKLRRMSVASERARRMSLMQEGKRSRAGSRASQQTCGTEKSQGGLSEILDGKAMEGMSPESVRLLREREKLLRWKAEREKSQFEQKDRDRIRERVRRANEMEDEKSRHLAKAQKKRGCCGMFGG
jgi:hypothetical protein